MRHAHLDDPPEGPRRARDASARGGAAQPRTGDHPAGRGERGRDEPGDDGGGRHRHRGVRHLSRALPAAGPGAGDGHRGRQRRRAPARPDPPAGRPPPAVSWCSCRPTRRTCPRSRRPSARSRPWSRRPPRAPGQPWTPRPPPHWTQSPQPTSPAGSLTPATAPDKLHENRCETFRTALIERIGAWETPPPLGETFHYYRCWLQTLEQVL